MTTTPFDSPNRRAKDNKDSSECPPEQIRANNKHSREFAKRMIVEGIMPLETVSRLSGLSLAAVQGLAVFKNET